MLVNVTGQAMDGIGRNYAVNLAPTNFDSRRCNNVQQYC